ncbi:unnamed protein product [Lepeophtheirus salmonis]|uniref:(salmon louse) hypothetical protein n=1 Tax=Lepeophtheirus salmonis TaxID=72036 RepID=A0A7R8CEY5_LEPSM|nr:unnamed protein product [Lepeophtheirus salmonis]CAF2795363.1 unnamed protein product [Lepeophtheirus salmonis]
MIALEKEVDIFDMTYILDCVKENNLRTDLGNYRLGISLFEEYDPYDILIGEKTWMDIKKLNDIGEECSQLDNFDKAVLTPSASSKNRKINRPYSHDEQVDILKFIISHGKHNKLKDINTWREMEADGVCSGLRAATSLKEHFRKQILPRIHVKTYPQFSEEDLNKILRGWKGSKAFVPPSFKVEVLERSSTPKKSVPCNNDAANHRQANVKSENSVRALRKSPRKLIHSDKTRIDESFDTNNKEEEEPTNPSNKRIKLCSLNKPKASSTPIHKYFVKESQVRITETQEKTNSKNIPSHCLNSTNFGSFPEELVAFLEKGSQSNLHYDREQCLNKESTTSNKGRKSMSLVNYYELKENRISPKRNEDENSIPIIIDGAKGQLGGRSGVGDVYVTVSKALGLSQTDPLKSKEHEAFTKTRMSQSLNYSSQTKFLATWNPGQKDDSQEPEEKEHSSDLDSSSESNNSRDTEDSSNDLCRKNGGDSRNEGNTALSNSFPKNKSQLFMNFPNSPNLMISNVKYSTGVNCVEDNETMNIVPNEVEGGSQISITEHKVILTGEPMNENTVLVKDYDKNLLKCINKKIVKVALRRLSSIQLSKFGIHSEPLESSYIDESDTNRSDSSEDEVILPSNHDRNNAQISQSQPLSNKSSGLAHHLSLTQEPTRQPRRGRPPYKQTKPATKKKAVLHSKNVKARSNSRKRQLYSSKEESIPIAFTPVESATVSSRVSKNNFQSLVFPYKNPTQKTFNDNKDLSSEEENEEYHPSDNSDTSGNSVCSMKLRNAQRPHIDSHQKHRERKKALKIKKKAETETLDFDTVFPIQKKESSEDSFTVEEDAILLELLGKGHISGSDIKQLYKSKALPGRSISSIKKRLYDLKIVNWIVKRHCYGALSGNLIWKRIESDRTLRHKSADSIHKRFMSHILPNISSFDLEKERKKSTRMSVEEECSGARSGKEMNSVDCEEDGMMQDKLLEELLRLRLRLADNSCSNSSSSSSMLPPKQRLKLFQPRSKFEQFKDILQESQLRHCCEVQSHKEEVGLRATWSELKDGIAAIYSNILSGANSHDKPDLTPLQDKVAQLTWKDPHQLFVRLESGIREFVIDLKLQLIELLQKQAKNPSLAQDFIQSLLDGYEKICTAAAYISPALQELEMGHLRIFGLTWELMNKHLYQSIIYTDPLIQNNLPIFISQLRSLYPDKEHEARYTELVRSYLDFDVEMEKIGAFWKLSEPLIANYNKEQVLLMEKQRMLKEDWEKFKMQRKAIDKQLKEEGADQDNGQSSDASQSDEKSDENTEGLKENGDCECHACASLASISQTLSKCAITDTPPNSPPNVPANTGVASNLDLYPHIHGSSDLSNTTLTINNTKTSSTSSYSSSNQTCVPLENAEAQAPLLTHDSSSCSSSSSSSSINSQIVNGDSKLSLEDSTEPVPLIQSSSLNMGVDAASPSTNIVITTTSSSSCVSSSQSTSQVVVVAVAAQQQLLLPPPKEKYVPPIMEILEKLINFCNNTTVGIRKMPPAPSASAVRKGKVPPPPLEDEEDLTEDEDTCSSSSASADSKHCSCCYCEVFGHGGASVAPVSRNYPEMRERLRLLLNKKKKCKQQQQQVKAKSVIENKEKLQQPPQPVQPAPPPPQQPHHHHHHHLHHHSSKANDIQPVLPIPISTSASTSKISDKSTLLQENKQQHKSSINNMNVKQQQQHVQTSSQQAKSRDVEELLEYIEGNLKTTNEKKRAKKDRQRQQRLEELRRREEEERIVKQKEEEERRLREEEQRRDKERAHQILKKPPLPHAAPPSKPDFQMDAAQRLEELKAQHLREVEQLKIIQQQQLEETQRSLLLQHQRTSSKNVVVPSSSSSQSNSSFNLKQALTAASISTTTASSASSSTSNSSKSGGSKQVRITRTPNGGVEFSTVEDPCTSSSSVMNNGVPSSPPALSTASMAFANNGMMFKPSIPSSKLSSNQPMVTIKRVHTGSKLLYTLINGQVHKSQHAPVDLIPGAKALKTSSGDGGANLQLSKKQRKKLRKQFKSVEELRSSSPVNTFTATENYAPQKSVSTSALKGLPTTPEGKLDLDNLNLPPGISITRIEGPSAAAPSASSMMVPPPMFPGGLIPTPNGTPVGYSAMAGMPPSLNGPNVIVVDTSTLTTREEEEAEKNNKKIVIPPMQQPQTLVNNNFPGFLQPEMPPPTTTSASSNHEDNISSSSGPQVLIKNINGQVVITPVPGTGATPDSIPAKLNGNSNNNNSTRENIDEINSIFAPKDIDLENGEIDDDEREIEAFKRFCFNSVPLQQKTKVNFDVKKYRF